MILISVGRQSLLAEAQYEPTQLPAEHKDAELKDSVGRKERLSQYQLLSCALLVVDPNIIAV
jgi:hypothetical protein